MAPDDDAARKTYRYLRLGMIGAVVLLAASVLIEHFETDPLCWQTSISAYYFTPVRTVFVGVMIAIGLNLIAIKGSTEPEDWLLNIAGFLAPIVAFVPTTDVGTCSTVPITESPTRTTAGGETVLADWVQKNVDNNVQALLWTGLFGVVVAAVVTVATVTLDARDTESPGGFKEALQRRRAMVLGVPAGAIGLGIAAVVIHAPTFTTYAHGWSAIAMFFFLGLAAFVNGWDCRTHGRPKYSVIYFVIAALMGLTAALFFMGWEYKILAIEVVEISLFVAFWSVQSVELWSTTLRAERKTAAPVSELVA